MVYIFLVTKHLTKQKHTHTKKQIKKKRNDFSLQPQEFLIKKKQTKKKQEAQKI